MTTLDSVPDLSERQRELLTGWLPGATVVRDHSWGLVERTVLEVEHDGATYVVKAGGPDDHHMRRELRAHREWLAPWTVTRPGARALHVDDDASLLVVTRHLPGHLVEGAPEADEPDVFRQAGSLLALLHGQVAVPADDFEARENRKMIAWLDREHRIEPDVEERLRTEVASWPAPGATLVPTHGDWQPRNWLAARRHRQRDRLRPGRPAAGVHRPGSPRGAGLRRATRGWRAPSWMATARIPGSRRRGTASGYGRRSARPCGPSRSATGASRSRATG